jgi:hypothetical protein
MISGLGKRPASETLRRDQWLIPLAPLRGLHGRAVRLAHIAN